MRTVHLKLATVALATAALSVFTACPPGEGVEGEGEGEGECERDTDCGAGRICDKENDGDDLPTAQDPFGVCIRVACFQDDQCDEGEKCDLRRGLCVPENLCDPAAANACPNPGDKCQYRDGLPVCAPPPAAASCALSPSLGYLSAGGDLQLEGVGFGAEGKLTPHTTFTWAATGGATVSASGVVTAPPTAGDVTVTGTTANGGATCQATIKVLPAVGANDLRILVLDLATRQPVANAPVAVRVGGTNTSLLTEADGTRTFPGAAAATSVSAFPANHQWHTLIDPPNDVIIYTASTQNADFVDGIKGGFDFSKVKTIGDIKLGLAGTAINAAITDLNFNTIIGEFVPTTIDISGITEPGGQEVELPEGLIIGLGQEDFKGQYAALSDKAGKGIGWALAGRVQLSKVGPIISQVSGSGSDDLDFGAILGAILPFFATFDHAVETGLDFTPAARANFDPNFQDVTITPNTLMGLSAEYDMPRLPCAPGAFANNSCTGNAFTSGAVLLSGVIVPGQGLVPLGLSAGLDVVSDGQNPDGIMEQSGENAPDPGKVLMDYAPPHDGIEGNLTVTVAIALDLASITDSDNLGASIITKVSRSLTATGNTFPSNAFLESQGGTFTAGTAGGLALTKAGDADFYRVNLDDNGELEWNVWFGDTTADFTIAELAQHSAVDVALRTQHADVQAFKLGTGYDGPSPSDFDDLFGLNGTDLDNLLYYLGGWSSESCRADGPCDAN